MSASSFFFVDEVDDDDKEKDGVTKPRQRSHFTELQQYTKIIPPALPTDPFLPKLVPL